MRILREGRHHWQGETSMREFARRLNDLVAYIFREDEFPDGLVLCTGTALVPESPFTLQSGDIVEIEIDGIGALRNPVARGNRRAVARAGCDDWRCGMTTELCSAAWQSEHTLPGLTVCSGRAACTSNFQPYLGIT
jgi:fumarylacetoacetate (FAA) hydrolase family protein